MLRLSSGSSSKQKSRSQEGQVPKDSPLFLPDIVSYEKGSSSGELI